MTCSISLFLPAIFCHLNALGFFFAVRFGAGFEAGFEADFGAALRAGLTAGLRVDLDAVAMCASFWINEERS
jgi:hypothetical protein